jgi:two-component system, LytTR family, response regulator AlgR
VTASPIPNLLIADDEAPARIRLTQLLGDISTDFPHRIIGEARTGREVIDAVNTGTVSIVLLDIRMPVVDGIEAAQHLVRLAAPPAIIFTTAYDEYAVKAFELNAIDYLMKPVREERLLAALRKAGHQTSLSLRGADNLALAQSPVRFRRHLSSHERGRISLIPIDDILFLRAEQKYVTVRTAQREYLVEDSLAKLEEEFSHRFVRIHRNCLVARDAIGGFERSQQEDESGWMLIVKGIGERLPVSRRQAHIVREFRSS